MRWKSDNPAVRGWCLCCHVRTATAIFGLFQMVIYLATLVGLAAYFAHPEKITFMMNVNFNDGTTNDSTDYPAFKRLSTDDAAVLFLIFLSVFVFALMLVIGSLKAIPRYLMPFFCIQVFEFCISCLTVASYSSFVYAYDMRAWIKTLDNEAIKQWLLGLSDDWLILICTVFTVSVLCLKAYFVSMVWACYKHLVQESLKPAARVYNDVEVANLEDTEMLLPPKYEEAVKISSEQGAPPAYCE